MRCSLCYCGYKLCWYLHIYETKQGHIIFIYDLLLTPQAFAARTQSLSKWGPYFPLNCFLPFSTMSYKHIIAKFSH